MERTLIATAAFGLEAVVRREIEKLGYPVEKTENGKVTFAGHEDAIAKANLWLRTADRVLIRMAEFTAADFEELYQNIAGIPWEEWIPVDGRIVVDAGSVKSTLTSVPAVQSVSAKAVYSRLTDFYGIEHFEESGPLFPIKVTLLKDRATVTLDTTGDGLFKRGYRVQEVAAPMKETLASALVQLSFYRKDRHLVDLCCGSGTIPIEAAMLARNIAPGLSRKFLAEEWPCLSPEIWKKARQEAYAAMDLESELNIEAVDIEPAAIEAAKANADAAGVGEDIRFTCMDMADFKARGERGVIVMNPPYGERIGDRAGIDHIYEALAGLRAAHPDWSLFLITSDKSVEEALGEADRRRKLYNGRLEACYYQYHGVK